MVQTKTSVRIGDHQEGRTKVVGRGETWTQSVEGTRFQDRLCWTESRWVRRAWASVWTRWTHNCGAKKGECGNQTSLWWRTTPLTGLHHRGQHSCSPLQKIKILKLCIYAPLVFASCEKGLCWTDRSLNIDTHNSTATVKLVKYCFSNPRGMWIGYKWSECM